MNIPYKNRISYYKKYYRDHKEHMDNYHNKYCQDLKDRVYNLLGGYKCSICGFDNPKALQIDHINGGGTKERRLMKQYTKYYLHILKCNGMGYQVLCANCNWIKRYDEKSK